MRETVVQEATESTPLRLLVVDDEETFRRVAVRELAAMGFDVRGVSSGEEALDLLEQQDADVILLDIKLPGMDGLETLRAIKESRPLAEVIMLTGHGTIETAIRSIRLGAYDYLTKPCKLEELEAIILKAGEKKALQQENRLLRQELARRDRLDEFIGRSQALRETVQLIERVAATDHTVLILGESGVGKELAARAIHRLSARRDKPFVVVDCTSLQEDLLQSELFGHEKGAFTGAVSLKHGLFEVADTGTIFLDEVGELSLSLQAKLLRVLETRSFRRLGGVRDIPVNVRIIAATNRDLERLKAEGRFREDLYYRLHVVPVVIPPLRERREDIEPLVQYFLSRNLVPARGRKRITPEALRLLVNYHWPGNVRELKNVIERAVILADGDTIDVEHLPSNLRFRPPFLSETTSAEYPSLEEVERMYIARLLKEFQGNRTQVARVLKISERTLYRKIRRYGL
ncbi:MAG TPA: sigma-54 dependent transcriptional regulator [Blastocatellia bacterium]|nr:sigma-54 dependent transcriptional regulator [Blastocatellia bacterium]